MLMFICFSGWWLGHGTEKRRWDKRSVSSQLHQETLAIPALSHNQPDLSIPVELKSQYFWSNQSCINCPQLISWKLIWRKNISIEGPWWCFVVFSVPYSTESVFEMSQESILWNRLSFQRFLKIYCFRIMASRLIIKFTVNANFTY